ncbi:MAG: glutamate 5-kinase [Polyangiaceae bacterium]|jgi:glutamate 5-kinase
MSEARAAVARSRRVIVKIGSRTLAAEAAPIFERLAATLANRRGTTFVVVSSGAIALGMKKLGYRARPKEVAKLQAAAAAGQSLLMRAYEEAFDARGLTVAQVLLTYADLADRTRSNNAREALAALIEAGAIPILNENDSVAVDEIKLDNDQLAAMVAPLVDAELVVLLSDVEGLLDADGRRVSIVRDVSRDALPHIRKSTSSVGTGGMASKVEAARRATLSGANVVVADARAANTLEAILAGEDVGTLFVAAPDRLSAKKYWIAFTLRPRGDIVLDRGAAQAVLTKGKSVLSVGVLGVRGDFRAGDAVRLVDAEAREIGRGLARCSATDAARVAGKVRDDLPQPLAEFAVVVHADELVVGEHAEAPPP